ncbi:hypothetical protein K7X08_000708 [Anisodus acutangulus]|uniref:Uncharacterized protein n=1 Tax=Anisodus acutangulus TaxID=402998 RepID=A0A9Q1M7H0_9SOLA|nr:hypothetical protein K7X08_000708 [Anisodus acutangulus]
MIAMRNLLPQDFPRNRSKVQQLVQLLDPVVDLEYARMDTTELACLVIKDFLDQWELQQLHLSLLFSREAQNLGVWLPEEVSSVEPICTLT